MAQISSFLPKFFYLDVNLTLQKHWAGFLALLPILFDFYNSFGRDKQG